MANPPTTESDLEIIGTARKPNFADLRARGLVGLPDPDPEILFRRAEFESEQAVLKTQVRYHKGENAPSFLRTKIDAFESGSDGVGSGSGSEGCESARSAEVDVEHDMVEEKFVNMAGSVGMPNLPDSLVANEACGGSEKAVRVLRDRSAVQVRPYAVEREMYRQMISTGKVKA